MSLIRTEKKNVLNAKDSLKTIHFAKILVTKPEILESLKSNDSKDDQVFILKKKKKKNL